VCSVTGINRLILIKEIMAGFCENTNNVWEKMQTVVMLNPAVHVESTE
jgi:hypothetical protein